LIVDDVLYKYTKGMHQCKAGPHRIQYEASYEQALSSSVLLFSCICFLYFPFISLTYQFLWILRLD
jgi:hypothetical protein